MARFLLLAIAALWSIPALADHSAVYLGETYYASQYEAGGRYASRAYHTDEMCLRIMAQFEATGWQHPSPSRRGYATKAMAAKGVVYSSPAVRTPQSSPQTFAFSGAVDKPKGGKWVTQTVEKSVPYEYQVSQCQTDFLGRRRCVLVTKTGYRIEQVQERKWVPDATTTVASAPAASETPAEIALDAPSLVSGPKFDGTPENVAEAMIAALRIKKGELFVDPGAGGGMLLEKAVAQGAEAVGIEIDPSIAKATRERFAADGIDAAVEVGDFTKLDSLDADVVGVYLHEEGLADLVPLLKPGARVVSYAHPLPGLDNERYQVGDEFYFYAEVPGESQTPRVVSFEAYEPKREVFGLKAPAPTFGL